jgi:polyphosphate kinase 2 (PPK2 family)
VSKKSTKKDSVNRGREKLGRKEYEAELAILQGELVAMQEWVKATGAKICIVFEGRDTAGKGGTIKRIVERVSPRVFRVVALPAPTEREKSQMYVSGTCRTCPQRARWSFSTAAGATAPGWSG